MVRCQEFKHWLNHQQVVDDNTFRQFMAHTRTCRPCSELHRSDMALDDILRQTMRRVEPPEGLMARARNKCRGESRHNPLRIFDFTR